MKIWVPILVFWVVVYCPSRMFAQNDSVQEILPVDVSATVKNTKQKVKIGNSYLSERDIRELATQDVGELMAKLAGVSLKSYGGLGGLKTVDYRSMGSTHTTVNVDGFSVVNNQTGQINLGQIQSDNVVGIAVSNIGLPELIPSVSSQISGSSILLQSFENIFSDSLLQLRSTVKVGSYKQMDGYLGVKYGSKKFFLSAFGKLRQASGNYSYSFNNGYQEESGVRKNNSYEDYYCGGSFGIKLTKRIKLRLGYRQSAINQGLPGAVILYNQTADEHLSAADKTLFGDVIMNSEKIIIRFYASVNSNSLKYDDPTYLNNSGSYHIAYDNTVLNSGLTFYSNPFRNGSVHAGVELMRSDLGASDSLFSKPLRNHIFGMLGASYRFNFGTFLFQLSSQFVNEQNRTAESASNKTAINPLIQFQSKKLKWLGLQQTVMYRNSFRMPSFNELYFNSIGNVNLEPETVHQANYNLEINPSVKETMWIKLNLFYNRVSNKILAIPTKNLFIWSMQNIGNVDVYGGELISSIRLYEGKNFEIRSDGNYTYQKSIDATAGSLNLGSQIAYTPIHSANLDLSFMYREIGLRVSNNYVSMRYSLNENIPQNEIQGFLLTDLTAFYKIKLKVRSQIRLQFTVKNMLNQSYAYIRSFVMPGRNYLISLSYAFN